MSDLEQVRSDQRLVANASELRSLVHQAREEVAREPRPWTTREVADFYRVQTATVNAWVKSGKLTPIRRRPGKRGTYLFAEADVRALEHEDRGGVDPRDAAAIMDAELRQRKARRGA